MIRKGISENQEGVSPVIAVILMVAITVVLSGIIYYWVSQFSTTSEKGLAYIGFEKDSVDNIWEISIIKVQGARIPLDNIFFRICDQNGVNTYRKSIGDTNPTTFAIDDTQIYPIAVNTSGVISRITSAPVTINDTFQDYIGAIFVFLDHDNDYFITTGDSIKIYSDFDGDGTEDIEMGNFFKINDLGGDNEYIKCHL